jgi:hypothetical protein
MTTNLTLRQSYDKSKLTAPKPAPAVPIAKREQVDPLAKWLGLDVAVTFISGRTLEGKLLEIGRFDFEVIGTDGIAQHVLKHAVERIHRK